jgi:isopenicillin-N N-acyltransferase-like protein
MADIQGIQLVHASSASAEERGHQIGSAAGERIRRSVATYEETFAHYTGLEWADVCDRAEKFVPLIEEYDADILEEMRGTAEGAGLDFRDVLAVNVRTEVMYGVSAAIAAECTACAFEPAEATASHVLLAQNWDWRPVTRDACIVLEVDQPPRPSFVTFLEAGLVGKMGFNSAGIGLMTNLLVTSADRGEPGVPYHVLLRGILNASTFDAAVEAIVDARRAASANYVIASEDGRVVDLETAPGGPENVRSIAPESGFLTHANTFDSPLNGLADRGLELLPDSPSRTARLRSLLAGAESTSVLELQKRLTDHSGFPASICRHPNEEDHPIERIATNASIIVDLTARELHLAVGPPCEGRYEVVRPGFVAERHADRLASTA